MTTPHPVDGFEISPRIPLEVDPFHQGNPSGTITPDPVGPEVTGLHDGSYAAPYNGGDDHRYFQVMNRAPLGAGGLWAEHTADQHQPTDLTRDQPIETEPQNETNTPTENTSNARGKGIIMAGETTITVIGNLTNDPELRFTPVSREFGKTDGTPVANFTIASTPRSFDSASNEWKDGETLFLRANAWREMGENVAASLTKGSRVIVSGRLKSRSYETKEGEKRTVIELEVDEIGASLRYAEVNISRNQRASQSSPYPRLEGSHAAG
jgi:single-strand DNA-binding protein